MASESQFWTGLFGASGGGALILLIAFLARNWFLTRLKGSIAHEYDKKIEKVKSDLRLETEGALEKLRQQYAENAASRSTALSGFLTSHAAAYTRRLDALQTLWESVIELRAAVPAIIYVVDMLGYRKNTFGRAAHNLLQNTKMVEAVKPFSDITTRVIKLRPLVGHRLFSLFYALHVACARATSETLHSYQNKNGDIRFWHEDKEVKKMLTAALSAEELQQFNGLPSEQLRWFRDILEKKIIAEIEHIFSGEESGAVAAEYADRLLEAAQAADPDKPSSMQARS
jgi:hypothetical protein